MVYRLTRMQWSFFSFFKRAVCMCDGCGFPPPPKGGEMLVSSKSELDELQEEVARRAQEQELRRKREKELEAAMGFNPHPSRFMDLDELQNQGNISAQENCLVGFGLTGLT